MKKNQKKWTVILGVVVVVLNLASSWYSVNFNESRILAPMDYSEYIFQWKDLPMIASVVLAVLYMLYIMFFIIYLTSVSVNTFFISIRSKRTIGYFTQVFQKHSFEQMKMQAHLWACA